ncbi:APC amino acid permease [Hygrophoropsis aurantiaca]|uniref:APC amino acid permease n=1 Tax=Hygrophoropsis aurantiaca TaxID=72124 RepID=A0ACB8AAL6_9AGAM|nr:APC amino acid permease [Hygrophoropsis aurantiaca]
MSSSSSSTPGETAPLLRSRPSSSSYDTITAAKYGVAVDEETGREGPDGHAESGDTQLFDNVPESKRQLGIASAIFLIFNRVIGTGVFAAPSIILRSSGSVGMTFIMWILGSLVAAAGTAVFVEFGTGIPRSGGEKTYMEYLIRRPKYIVTCVYAVYGMGLGWMSTSGIVFGEYALHALAIPVTPVNVRITGFLSVTFCLIMHGVFLKQGLWLQNALGLFKLVVLVLIALSGVACLAGVPGFEIGSQWERPENYGWHNLWEGTDLSANAFVTGMYNVIWSFIGYSNANYALSEVRDPVRTIKRAAPLALLFVACAYLAVNIAYFAVVSKADMLGSGTAAAALFFRNLYGPATSRLLSAIIALSTLANNLSILFSQGRVTQELGREGVLPYSSFFSSNKPFNAPLAGLFAQWLVSVITMLGAPPGDAYLFIVNLISYPLALFNIIISGGLLLLYTPAYKSYDWNPPFRAYKPVVAFFFFSNIFLAVVPMIPPLPGQSVYQRLPYWSHVATAIGIGFVGVIYWFVAFRWIPKQKGYKLERETVMQEDGISRNVFKRIPVHEAE